MRSPAVYRSSLANSAARCGPTPRTNCTGVENTSAGVRCRAEEPCCRTLSDVPLMPPLYGPTSDRDRMPRPYSPAILAGNIARPSWPVTQPGHLGRGHTQGRDNRSQHQFLTLRAAIASFTGGLGSRIQRIDPIKRIGREPNPPIVVSDIFDRIHQMLFVENEHRKLPTRPQRSRHQYSPAILAGRIHSPAILAGYLPTQDGAAS